MRATIVAWITPATSSPLISITCVGVVLAPALLIRRWNRNACYWDVYVEGPRHRALVDSARFGLWLARG